MVEFFHYPAKNFDGKNIKITIATGPVIIDKNKFLLHVSSSTGKYQFTGGRLDDSKSPQENAMYWPLHDLGVNIKLADGVDPFIIMDQMNINGEKEKIILIHYLASIEKDSTPTKGEFKWFSLDEILELEKRDNVSSPNIRIAAQHFLK